MVICLKCNNENPDDAVFCGFCGAKQEAAPAPEAAQTVYGYEVDQEKLMGAVGQLAPVPDDEPAQVDEAPVPEAAPEPEPTPEPEPEATPDDVAADEAETIPAETMSVDDLSETIPVGSGPETIAG